MKIVKSLKEHPFRSIMALIFILSFILRLSISLELLKNDIQVSNPSLVTDMATYMELSRKIADGAYDQPFYYQPFYYAVFLPSIIFLFGEGIPAILIAQSFISSLTVIFAGLAAAMLGGKKAGIYTALFVAFSSYLLLCVPYHLIETLQAFWLALISYTCILALRRGSARLWALLGLLTSFSILTRGNIWFLVPGIILSAFLAGNRRQPKAQFIFPLLFILTLLLPQIPFAYWNYMKTSRFSGPSTAAGAVLGLGNTPEAPPGGRNPGTGPGPMEYPETYLEWSSQQEQVPMLKRIFEWAISEPLAFLELQFRKVLLFWDYREIPNNIAFEYNGQKSLIWRFLAFIPSSALLSAFLSWFFYHTFLVLKTRKFSLKQVSFSKPIALNTYFVFAYCLATAAFYNLARFRAPSLPLFAIFAGIFVLDIRKILGNRYGEGKIFRLKIISLSVLLSIFIVFFSYDSYRFYEPAIMRIARPNGTHVKLDSKRLLVLDNGPQSFGGWELHEIKEGSEIIKTFSIPDFKQNRAAKFAFEIFFYSPGEITLKINDTEEKISSEHQGRMKKIFQLENLNAPHIEINFLKVDAKAFLFIDTQRNYSRTKVNGENPCGEFAARLYVNIQ